MNKLVVLGFMDGLEKIATERKAPEFTPEEEALLKRALRWAPQ